MNFRKLILIISIIFLSACDQYHQNDKSIIYIDDQKYSNTGFALIYDDKLKKEKKISKKINNRSLLIFHTKIKKNSFVKITNPINNKSIIAEVISNNVKFSEFYNSVITKRIVEIANTHSHGRVISFLEGGYDLIALSESIKYHLQGLI